MELRENRASAKMPIVAESVISILSGAAAHHHHSKESLCKIQGNLHFLSPHKTDPPSPSPRTITSMAGNSEARQGEGGYERPRHSTAELEHRKIKT